MALKNKLNKLVQKAIKLTDDLATNITYVQKIPGAYNPSTDTISSTTFTHTDVPALLVKLSDEDLEWWPANMVGQRALIAYEDLPITPDTSDHVLIGSVIWTVYRTRSVPGQSLHTLFLRLP